MIELPELLIVVGVLVLAGSYVLVIRYMLERADKASASNGVGEEK